MLKIKLSRGGKKQQPHYRIIVHEAKSKRDGKNTDILGYYIPFRIPAVIKLDIQKYDDWLNKGAKATETVAYLRTKVKDSNETTIAKPTNTKVSKKQKSKQEASTQS